MAMTGQGPWAPAQEAFNKFARLDPRQGQRLRELSARMARDDKMAFAIEAGRIYGLRQQKYNMTLKKQLNRDCKQPPVEQMW